jgi:hypothetical protein
MIAAAFAHLRRAESSSAKLSRLAATSLQLRLTEVDAMALGRLRWRWIAALTMTCCFSAAAIGRAQFTSLSDRSRSLLEGNWQSCRESDGHYAERVYDAKWPGMEPFEVHMGPYHEFALFRGIQDAHRDHNSSENLLKPFNIELVGRRGHQTWETAGLRLEVKLAGGSREDCESWYLTVQLASAASH